MKDETEKKILVADNEFHIIQVVALKFRKNGFNVFTAQDGASALDLAREHLPDVIVTDLRMPIMSGVEFVENLRANDRTMDIPVVMLTARDFEMDDEIKEQLGISACISKPFSPRELVRTVKDLLNQTITAKV
ncbi:MAG: response regulator [Planctomycetes bacterium]|nr:response regulator [Planctomycetota bacterium]